MHKVINDEIVSKRSSGMSCAEVAEDMGVSKSYVQRISAQHNIGVVSNRKPVKLDTINKVLENYDSITVEVGAYNGYIATVNDEFTGEEQPSVSKAIQSAIKRSNK